jgi:hypothetical protein
MSLIGAFSLPMTFADIPVTQPTGAGHAKLFQIILIAGAAFLLLATMVAVWKGWASRKEGFVWACVCVTAGVFVAEPGILGKLAKVLGIGRGADLLLYGSVVVMLIGFLMIYARLRQLRREMTLLVRDLAIRDAVTGGPAEGSDRGSSKER